MGRGQLLDAYLNGDISRRIFIRRLVAAGMSLSAAAAYAYVLSPAQPEAREQLVSEGAFYARTASQAGDSKLPSAKLATSEVSLLTLLSTGKLPVRVTSNEVGSVAVTAQVAQRGLASALPMTLGKTTVTFARPGSRTVRIRARGAALDALRSGSPMVLTVLSRAASGSGAANEARLRISLRS